jgi:hypothetical protein
MIQDTKIIISNNIIQYNSNIYTIPQCHKIIMIAKGISHTSSITFQAALLLSLEQRTSGARSCSCFEFLL